jgi:predicted N-formylglutamate amidohydrolase
MVGETHIRVGKQSFIEAEGIEIRQDLITSTKGQNEWIERMARHLTALLSDKELIAPCREPVYFGSYADKT